MTKDELLAEYRRIILIQGRDIKIYTDRIKELEKKLEEKEMVR